MNQPPAPSSRIDHRGLPDERYLDTMEARITSFIEHEEEMERIRTSLNKLRRELLDSRGSRNQCPGCFMAIYDGAAKQGWCCDCMPQRVKYEKEAYGY